MIIRIFAVVLLLLLCVVAYSEPSYQDLRRDDVELGL